MFRLEHCFIFTDIFSKKLCEYLISKAHLSAAFSINYFAFLQIADVKASRTIADANLSKRCRKKQIGELYSKRVG